MVPSVSADVGQELVTSAVDTLSSNIAILDGDGTILGVNDSWRKFGEANGLETVPDSVGMNYLDVAEAADDSDADRAASGIREVLRGNNEQFELEYPCHSPSENRWFLLRASGFTHDGARYATVAHINITERRRRERALREAYEISVSERTFPEKVDGLLALGREVLRLDYGTLSRVQDGEYTFEAVAAPDNADLSAGDTASLDTLPNCQQVIESEERVVLSDIRAEAPELLDPELGITAYLGAPVVVNDRVRGTFCFYSTASRDEQFSDWEVTFVNLLSNWASKSLECRHYTDLLGALETAFPDLAFLIDVKGTYRDYLAGSEINDRLVVPPSELLGQTLHEVLPAGTADQLLATVRDTLDTGQLQTVEYEIEVSAGSRWFEARVAPVADGEYDSDTVVFVARDITERKEQERELQQHRDELAHLNRLNTLVRQLIQALQDTDSREGIETAVCDRLTASDVYQGAWIGVRESTITGNQMVAPHTAAGIDRFDFDDIPTFEGPAKAAVQTGTVQVVDDIATDGEFTDARQEFALEHDHHSLAAIPLTTGGVTYGVLVVYFHSDQTISEDERTIIADLGEMIAQAIQRVHSQQALSAETAVALELRFPDTDLLLGEASTEFDCELAIEQWVSTNDGGAIYYLSVHDADPGRVSAFLQDATVDCDSIVAREADDDRLARIELRFADQPNLPTDILSNYGGSITNARFANGDVVLGVELPPAVDIRTVVDALCEGAPNVELLSKQTIDQSITTGTEFQSQITGQFTPKQETTLKAAYARGYYAWPRDITVEELAETFDVSAPTLHYRLRKAHQMIVSAVVEDTEIPMEGQR